MSAGSGCRGTRALCVGALVASLFVSLAGASLASANTNTVQPYEVPGSPAAMWATGPLCPEASYCDYDSWLAQSGHAVADIPENSLPPGLPGSKPLLPDKPIVSPSPTVRFTVPCYFIWDPSARSSYGGNDIHCEARIYGVSGEATVTNSSPKKVLVGSGWKLLASGDATVGHVEEGGVKFITHVTCEGHAGCELYKKDITLEMFTPNIETRLVFGTRYSEGESLSWGWIPEQWWEVGAETPSVECENFEYGPSRCEWVGYSSGEPVLCDSGVAGTGSPSWECGSSESIPGFDVATGDFDFGEKESHPAFGWEELPVLVVEPTALVQSNILVTGILYAPPGAKSTVAYEDKKSRSLQVGVSEEHSSTKIESNGSTEGYKMELSLGEPTIGGTKVPLFVPNSGTRKSVGWAESTKEVSSQSTGESATVTGITAEKWTTVAHEFKDASWWEKELGEADSWFLHDQIKILVHPQWAVWDFTNPQTGEEGFTQQLVGTGGERLVAVDKLIESCIGWEHPQENYEIEAEPDISLGKTECLELLKLDPFTEEFASLLKNHQSPWGAVAPGNQAPNLAKLVAEPEPRFVTLTQCCEFQNDQEVSAEVEKELATQKLKKLVTEKTYTSSYESKVESVLTSSWDFGVKFPESLGSVTLEKEAKQMSGTSLNVSYKNSTIHTEESMEGAKVNFKAKENQEPFVVLGFVDETYGTFLFQPLKLKQEDEKGKEIKLPAIGEPLSGKEAKVAGKVSRLEEKPLAAEMKASARIEKKEEAQVAKIRKTAEKAAEKEQRKEEKEEEKAQKSEGMEKEKKSSLDKRSG